MSIAYFGGVARVLLEGDESFAVALKHVEIDPV
jgi:hypothetical protein